MKLIFIFILLFSLNFSGALQPVKNKTPFIIGGRETTIEQFPHQMALITRNTYSCGASIISPRHGLTAAHCSDGPANILQLRGGSTVWWKGYSFNVRRYVQHPSWGSNGLDFDIAVLTVKRPMTGYPNISPIRLPPVCNTICCGVCPGRNMVQATGWGVYNLLTWDSPERLRRVALPIVSHAECRRRWGGNLSSTFFCTSSSNGRDTCNGDSGSPVIRNGIQVGVVSFGPENCADGSAPAGVVRLESPEIRSFILRELRP